ncbi:hypothetical protein T07_11488 [Trichinella nelsoni]|uniref:Uncharacterized protein n=1 Tax=Trichinella nelsoni TaxID=6336 RepID=A0A0V0S8M7_9BILA|nr:hypothetical protein T07_11488 [Trichinella nelsoni]
MHRALTRIIFFGNHKYSHHYCQLIEECCHYGGSSVGAENLHCWDVGQNSQCKAEHIRQYGDRDRYGCFRHCLTHTFFYRNSSLVSYKRCTVKRLILFFYTLKCYSSSFRCLPMHGSRSQH